jgi:hypothetical protein
MKTEIDWELSCFKFVLRDADVGGDLLFAATITASSEFLLYGVRSTAST